VVLDLSNNSFSSQDLCHVCKCIAKVERTLLLVSCLRDSSGKERCFNSSEIQLIKNSLVEYESVRYKYKLFAAIVHDKKEAFSLDMIDTW